MSYCTSGLFWHKLGKLQLPCISCITYPCVNRDIATHVKDNTCRKNFLIEPRNKNKNKSRGTMTPLHVWQQNGVKDRFPFFNFFVSLAYFRLILPPSWKRSHWVSDLIWLVSLLRNVAGATENLNSLFLLAQIGHYWTIFAFQYCELLDKISMLDKRYISHFQAIMVHQKCSSIQYTSGT